jgi:SagB-type dehydrogenase family enzyme
MFGTARTGLTEALSFLCFTFLFIWISYGKKDGVSNITVSDHFLLVRTKSASLNETMVGPSSRSRLRTSRGLVMYFEDNDMFLENYIARQTFHGSADTILLLDYFRRWRTVAQALGAFDEYSRNSVINSIRDLLRRGLLIVEGSEKDILEEKFSNKWLWPIAARHYHFASRLAEASTSAEIREFYEKHLKGKAQPSIYKTYPSSRKFSLPPTSGHKTPIFRTMLQRRTTREFSGESITLNQLSTIAFYTWGKVSTYKTREFGPLLHKASPSAGARHPIEAYAVINKVDNIPPGIYHYSVKDHSLELLKPGDFRDKCIEFAAGQRWVRNASAFFIMTAAVSRTAWKYRTPRVYRALLLDAGHLSQSFLLASTALGLGTFCIGIISDVTIERELGINGIDEIALFAVGVGRSAERTGSIRKSPSSKARPRTRPY